MDEMLMEDEMSRSDELMSLLDELAEENPKAAKKFGKIKSDLMAAMGEEESPEEDELGEMDYSEEDEYADEEMSDEELEKLLG